MLLPYTGNPRQRMVYCGAKDGWERWTDKPFSHGSVCWFIPLGEAQC